MKHYFKLLLLIACCLVFSSRVDANPVSSRSGVQVVEYPAGTVNIVAYSEASMPYEAGVYYCLKASATLYRDGTEIDYREDTPPCAYYVGASTMTAYAEIVIPDDGLNAQYIVDGDFYVMPEYNSGDADYYNYQSYLDPPYIFGEDSYGFYGPGPAYPNAGEILLGTVYSIFQRGIPPNWCYDERDDIKSEYITYRVNMYPACADFTQNRHSQYFTFNELNSGDYSWALIRSPLVVAWGYDGLDRWRVLYSLDVGRICSSCYRNPARNAYVGGARQSRHMYGDAADLRNESNTEQEWLDMEDAADGAGADYIEPRNQSGIGHVHADWRYHGGGYR